MMISNSDGSEKSAVYASADAIDGQSSSEKSRSTCSRKSFNLASIGILPRQFVAWNERPILDNALTPAAAWPPMPSCTGGQSWTQKIHQMHRPGPI
jgi:hypothetical protein